MFISVIIPTRNRHAYVKALIHDLKRQENANFEIIVVDQSEKFEELKGCEHIKTETLGACVSKNIGANAANGDILVFLDDDARVDPNFIREITKPIIDSKFPVVAGAICDSSGNYPQSNDSFLKVNTDNFIKAFTSNPSSTESRISLAFPAGCSAMLKDVFFAVGGFRESFDPTGAAEDREMALKLYTYGYPIWYNPNAKLYHLSAGAGGSRDLGSRTIMLDIHTYDICRTYFSKTLSNSFKAHIIKKHRRAFLVSLYKLKQIRTKYRQMCMVYRLINKRHA